MSHTPFGYRIENGKAVIDKVESEKLIILFTSYLKGASLTAAAEVAGIKSLHSGIGKMLNNKRYIGDEYYPPIIDANTFSAVQDERMNRAKKLGRVRNPKPEKEVLYPTVFCITKSKGRFDDPFIQAEYIYTLIESKVKDDGSK